jgi:hypothetical protein
MHLRLPSVVLGEPTHPQNPKLLGHQGIVAEMELTLEIRNQEEVASILLHFAEGSLSLLEVVWYNFPDALPSSWVEVSRRIIVSG